MWCLRISPQTPSGMSPENASTELPGGRTPTIFSFPPFFSPFPPLNPMAMALRQSSHRPGLRFSKKGGESMLHFFSPPSFLPLFPSVSARRIEGPRDKGDNTEAVNRGFFFSFPPPLLFLLFLLKRLSAIFGKRVAISSGVVNTSAHEAGPSLFLSPFLFPPFFFFPPAPLCRGRARCGTLTLGMIAAAPNSVDFRSPSPFFSPSSFFPSNFSASEDHMFFARSLDIGQVKAEVVGDLVALTPPLLPSLFFFFPLIDKKRLRIVTD